MTAKPSKLVRDKKRILYIGAECKPFSQVGGVGDVVGEMPIALKRKGYDVHIVTPGYASIKDDYIRSATDDGTCTVEFKAVGDPRLSDADALKVTYKTGMLEDVPVHFVMNDTYFGTRVDNRYGRPYVDSKDMAFKDDALRFSFFAKAVLPLIERLQPHIVHINDWIGGYLLGWMKIRGLLDNKNSPATVLTIHNIGYQGNMWRHAVAGWDMEQLANDHRTAAFFSDPRASWNNVNPLRLAMELADVTNTVSPNYMKEMTQPEEQSRYFEGGKGLDGIARQLESQGRLYGILNGIQYRIPEPTDDAFNELMAEKAAIRKRFEAYFKKPDGLLVGFVGRCVEQKFKLLTEKLGDKTVLEHILDIPDVNVAFLATGEPLYESFMANIDVAPYDENRKYSDLLFGGRRGNYVSTVAFDRERAHQIWLASDIFLMPSLFEPCGITQLQSMELATPPLVRGTGGLADTVVDYSQPKSTGFVCDGTTRDGVLKSIIDGVIAARTMKSARPNAFLEMQKRAFFSRFTWENALRFYEELYESALRRSTSSSAKK
jgi:starch synthase